jgi:hypothetical protein
MYRCYHSAHQIPSALGLCTVFSAKYDNSPHLDSFSHLCTDDSLDSQDLHDFHDTRDLPLDTFDFDFDNLDTHLPDTQGFSLPLSSLASSSHNDGGQALGIHTKYHLLINGQLLTCHLHDTLDRYI